MRNLTILPDRDVRERLRVQQADYYGVDRKPNMEIDGLERIAQRDALLKNGSDQRRQG